MKHLSMVGVKFVLDTLYTKNVPLYKGSVGTEDLAVRVAQIATMVIPRWLLCPLPPSLCWLD